MDLTAEIHAELERAEASRTAGNEGRARVCARRAAGLAARFFLTQYGIRRRSTSTYDALRALEQFPGLAPDLKQAALHLTMHVTGEFALPIKVDLIAEARKLIGGLS